MIFAETSWSDYGILGLVVLSLGGFVMYLMREHKTERKDFVAERLGILKTHKDERKEWKDDTLNAQSELRNVVASLESAIREQSQKR